MRNRASGRKSNVEPPQIELELPEEMKRPIDRVIEAHKRGDREAFGAALEELWRSNSQSRRDRQ